jgi:putative membrane protein insertion efficiency factor
VVFDGPWRRRRRQPNVPDESGYPNQDPYGYPPQYGAPYRGGFRTYRGYGFGGGNSSCLRDLLFLDAGCCIAEGLGCGGQLLLVAPPAARSVGLRTVQPDAARYWLTRWLLAVIAIYQQQISPRRPACCRFSPTCSHYAAEALHTYGLRRGLWLTVRRLFRCRPGAVGGYDPVP